MSDLTALARELRSRLPAAALSSQPDPRYEVDGLRPALVASPGSPAEAAAVLSAARAARAAVLPFGGGTQTGLGMPPERYDLALDLRRLDRVVEHQPADLTATVEAGITLAALQRALAAHGQWLPLDPPLPEAATVGGVLAANASGPSRHRYGTARDLVIGMTVALADGSLVKSGGRVVKNVAGYDMAKLHIGALGTLGVIVQVSFKVAPIPAQTAAAAITGPLAVLMSTTSRLADGRLPLQAIVLEKGPAAGEWALHVGFAGGAAAVERCRRELALVAPGAEFGVALPALPTGAVLVRGSVPPAAAFSLCEAFADAAASVTAYPTVGIVYGAWDGAPPAEVLLTLRQRCVQADGALVLERAPVDLKRRVDVWGPPRNDFALMRRIKEQLDPERVLNPGRYLGGL